MEWNQMKKVMGMDIHDAELEINARRASAAFWAYNILGDAFSSVSEESDTTPAGLADRDRRQAAVSNMLRAVGVDLANQEQRDIIVIVLLLQQQICNDPDEALEFALTICELALNNEPGIDLPEAR